MFQKRMQTLQFRISRCQMKNFLQNNFFRRNYFKSSNYFIDGFCKIFCRKNTILWILKRTDNKPGPSRERPEPTSPKDFSDKILSWMLRVASLLLTAVLLLLTNSNRRWPRRIRLEAEAKNLCDEASRIDPAMWIVEDTKESCMDFLCSTFLVL
jgi:hypothetical protein